MSCPVLLNPPRVCCCPCFSSSIFLSVEFFDSFPSFCLGIGFPVSSLSEFAAIFFAFSAMTFCASRDSSHRPCMTRKQWLSVLPDLPVVLARLADYSCPFSCCMTHHQLLFYLLACGFALLQLLHGLRGRFLGPFAFVCHVLGA